MKPKASALLEPEVGLFLGGDPVEDQEICGKNPLFYGVVQFSGGRRFHAYVKVLPPKQMYAEILSAEIGRQLGLPIPFTTVVVAHGEDVGINAAKVVCLASVDTSSMPISRIVHLEDVNPLLHKWSHRSAAIVFDELIANGDRNLRNLLLGSDGKIWLIDHEEALSDPLSVPHRAICNHILERLIENVPSFRRRRYGKILSQQALLLRSCDFYKHAKQSLPGNCRVDRSHFEEVVEFLNQRIHHLPQLIGEAVYQKQNYLERWR